jgi:hypothetical protein
LQKPEQQVPLPVHAALIPQQAAQAPLQQTPLGQVLPFGTGTHAFPWH